MGNYSKTAAGAGPRTELHDLLGLTGAEISVNSLPEGAGVPFVHYHKENEEIYYIIEGKGKAVIDGDETDIVAGDFQSNVPDWLSSTAKLFPTHASRLSQPMRNARTDARLLIWVHKPLPSLSSRTTSSNSPK